MGRKNDRTKCVGGGGGWLEKGYRNKGRERVMKTMKTRFLSKFVEYLSPLWYLVTNLSPLPN